MLCYVCVVLVCVVCALCVCVRACVRVCVCMHVCEYAHTSACFCDCACMHACIICYVTVSYSVLHGCAANIGGRGEMTDGLPTRTVGWTTTNQTQ